MMRHGKKSKQGYSLVELLAAALAASVLALTAGTMLFHAYDAWNENHEAVNVHRDGRHAMDMMTRAVRAASFARVVTAENNNLVIANAAGTSSVRFQRSRQDLIYDPDTGVDGDEIALVADGARRFIVGKTATAVTVRLDLDREGETMRLDSVMTFRN
jgi:Tfp pilus assembly protein PilW